MTTQAQAPTEEMRERARERSYNACVHLQDQLIPSAFNQLLLNLDDAFLAHAAAQDALAVERERERCAEIIEKHRHTIVCRGHLTKAIRAQGEK